MRRRRTSQFHLVSLRSGVTVSVMTKKYSAQSPVLRVMNSIGLAPSLSRKPNATSRSKGNKASTNNTLRNKRTCVVERSLSDIGHTLKIALQIHAAIQPGDIVVAIEHQRLALAREEAVLTDAPLGGLRPARVVDIRIDVGIKTVFLRRVDAPGSFRLFLKKADLDDRLGRLEAILPRQNNAHRRTVLVGQHFAVHAQRQ